MRVAAVNDLLEPFLHVMAQYPNKLAIARTEERVILPVVKSLNKNTPASSVLRYVDFQALSARLFELATSKYKTQLAMGSFLSLIVFLWQTHTRPQ